MSEGENAAPSSAPFFVPGVDAQTHSIMSEALISRGLATREQTQQDWANIEAGQYTNEITPSAQPEVTVMVGGETSDIDAEIFAAPANSSQYDFTGVPAPTVDQTEEYQAVTGAMRDALFEAQLPKAIGDHFAKSLFNELSKGAKSDYEISISRQSAVAQLSAMWGDKTEENIQLANALIPAMEKHIPGIKAWLRDTGLGNDPLIISQFYNTARARGLTLR